jgi:glycosyltransferase involved in cell wall biosynthesis
MPSALPKDLAMSDSDTSVRPEAATVPTPGSLTVVIPAYNSAQWLPQTLGHLMEALRGSPWSDVDLVVVDDGSTDGTADTVEALGLPVPVSVVRQTQQGRLLARRTGIEKARGEFVLLLDSRIFVDRNSLAFAAEVMRERPEAQVWTAHVDVATGGNPYAAFWKTVAHLGWYHYFRRPRLAAYGQEDFDRYPKGTGCFLAPRDVLLDAYERFSTFYDDLRNANDDTSLIFEIAGRTPIMVGPEFSATYNARGSLVPFLRHAFHRGIVFVDGHFHRGRRFFWPCAGFLVLTPVLGAAAVARPRLVLVLAAGATASVAPVVRGAGLSTSEAVATAALVPPFAAAYGTGIWTGVALAARSRLRRRRPSAA